MRISRKLSFISTFCIVLNSCAPTQNVILNNTHKGTFPLHGQFCGPETPLIQGIDINLHVKELESIEPIDFVDAICKKHDICYAQRGYFDKKCDKLLLSEISEYRERASKRCLGLSLLIYTHIKSLSSVSEFEFTEKWINDYGKVDNPVSAILLAPFGAVSIAADVFFNTVDVATAGVVGVGSVYNGVTTTAIDAIVEVTPSKKDPRLDYFLPGRFERCD